MEKPVAAAIRQEFQNAGIYGIDVEYVPLAFGPVVQM
jgi:hypothetical protein